MQTWNQNLSSATWKVSLPSWLVNKKGHAVWHSLLLNNDFMLNIFLKILFLDFDVCQIHLRLNLQSHEDFFSCLISVIKTSRHNIIRAPRSFRRLLHVQWVSSETSPRFSGNWNIVVSRHMETAHTTVVKLLQLLFKWSQCCLLRLVYRRKLGW